MDPRVRFTPRFAAIKRPRLYLDNSVISAYDDPRFPASNWVIDAAKVGRLVLVISDVTMVEHRRAPKDIQDVLRKVPSASIEIIRISEEAYLLAEAFVEARIITYKWLFDASHVAAATIARVDALLSWNKDHFLNENRLVKFNGIIRLRGHREVVIIRPSEVLTDAQE